MVTNFSGRNVNGQTLSYIQLASFTNIFENQVLCFLVTKPIAFYKLTAIFSGKLLVYSVYGTKSV